MQLIVPYQTKKKNYKNKCMFLHYLNKKHFTASAKYPIKHSK